MKNKLLLFLLCGILLIGVTGCGKKVTKEKEKSLSNLVDIEKIYYNENDDSSISMYLVYAVKSDTEKDITIGASANLIVDSQTNNSAFYTYDMNKNVIAELGFPTVVDYKTLYGGSDEKVRYVATFTINKNYVDNKEEIVLQVPINGTVSENSSVTKYEYLEKSFTFDEIEIFSYSENSEFIQELEKDYK